MDARKDICLIGKYGVSLEDVLFGRKWYSLDDNGELMRFVFRQNGRVKVEKGCERNVFHWKEECGELFISHKKGVYDDKNLYLRFNPVFVFSFGLTERVCKCFLINEIERDEKFRILFSFGIDEDLKEEEGNFDELKGEKLVRKVERFSERVVENIRSLRTKVAQCISDPVSEFSDFHIGFYMNRSEIRSIVTSMFMVFIPMFLYVLFPYKQYLLRCFFVTLFADVIVSSIYLFVRLCYFFKGRNRIEGVKSAFKKAFGKPMSIFGQEIACQIMFSRFSCIDILED